MIYLCYREGSKYDTRFMVKDFHSVKELLTYLGDMPRTRILGVFNGARLSPIIGEKRVVRKSVLGFKTYTEPKEEKQEDNNG